jgi:TolB protein
MNARQHRAAWCRFLFCLLVISIVPVAAAQVEPPPLKKSFLWLKEPPSTRFSSPATPEPAPSRSAMNLDVWNLIAYTSFPDDNPEIYVSRSNMGTTTRLTNHPAGDFYPRLNREATTVAFVSNRDGNSEIYRVDVDGTDLRRLTTNGVHDTQPVWSSDNLRLAFASQRDGNWNIYAMNADGSSQIRMTSAAADDLMPTWSPNGQQIAWVQVSGSYATIWVMNGDGSNPHPITGALRYLQRPIWSPDGTRIAFDYDANGDGWNDLAMINADGSGLRVVYYSPREMYDTGMGSWTPDGHVLLFTGLHYELYQGRLLLTGVTVNEVPAIGGQSSIVWGLNGQAGFPDIRRMDETPPETAVTRLPQYSRPINMPVSWGGSDGGASKIAFYDVQYRVGANGNWVDWLIKVEVTAHIYTGVPGTTVYFRSRARDHAGNVEAWNATADTSTTFYTWGLSGQVTDSRGVALPDASLAVHPTPANTPRTQPDGRYLARLTAEGNHTVGVSQVGYGAVPNSTLRVTADQGLDLVLPPLDSVLQNGGFEASADQPSGWTAGGSLPTAMTTVAPHTGANAAALGQSCPSPCVDGAQPTQHNSTGARLAVDSAGTVHMVWATYEPDPWHTSVYYAMRPRDGAWTSPLKLAAGVGPQIAIDGHGRVHVVWSWSGGLYYSERSAAGEWSAPVSLGISGFGIFTADKHGGLHLIYMCAPMDCPSSGRIYYRERLASGDWQPPLLLDKGDGTGSTNYALALGADGTLHLAWVETDVYVPSLIYQSRRSDGTWSPRETVLVNKIAGLRLAAGPSGEAHLFYTWDLTTYLHRSSTGLWSGARTLPGVYTDGSVAVDDYGTVHMLVPWIVNGEDVAHYYRKDPNMDWAGPTVMMKTKLYAAAIANDPDGRLHISWSDSSTTDARILYQTTSKLATAGSAVLRQTVTIPATMHRPTLSFMYNLIGATPANGSRFEVQLTRDTTSSTIFSTDTRTPWKQAWVDLQPWAGQTVDLSFVLYQASDAPHAQVLVDDVSLGSWLTPVIKSVAPTRADAGTSITITGENFIATPKVYINTLALSNVRWLDEQTLQAILPPRVRPGAYTVTVVNPGNQKTALSNGIRIGWQVYAPGIMRP